MTTPPTSPERERLRAAVARILDVFVAREATAEQFANWSEMAETFAASVEQNPPSSLMWGLGTKGMMAIEGILTPAGVEPKATMATDRVTASVVFGPDQQGHRGVAHGGTVAHAFDSLFGMFYTFPRFPLYTRELTVRYRKPVPIETNIALEGYIDRIEGRQTFLRGTATRDGVVLAEAEAIMVTGPKG